MHKEEQHIWKQDVLRHPYPFTGSLHIYIADPHLKHPYPVCHRMSNSHPNSSVSLKNGGFTERVCELGNSSVRDAVTSWPQRDDYEARPKTAHNSLQSWMGGQTRRLGEGLQTKPRRHESHLYSGTTMSRTPTAYLGRGFPLQPTVKLFLLWSSVCSVLPGGDAVFGRSSSTRARNVKQDY